MHAPERDALVDERDGALMIEADTAEEALALVRDQLGDDAEILEARKVRRGGWKGFFALERVELTARRSPWARVGEGAGRPAPTATPDDDVAATRQRLAQEQVRDQEDFDRMLRRLLQRDDVDATVAAGTPEPAPAPPPPAPAAPTPAAPTPAPAPIASVPDPVAPAPAPAPATPTPEPEPAAPPPDPGVASPPGGVDWALAHLEALRLPRRLIDASVCADDDDLARVQAIAGAVGAMCRPLPTGTPAYVGPRLGRLAKALDIPLVRLGAASSPAGPVALEAPDTPEGRAWATRLAGDRWLHVVASGRRWHGFVFEDAMAVSWLESAQLPMALAVGERLGLVLGHGPASRPGQLLRATPLDVALAVRALLPRA